MNIKNPSRTTAISRQANVEARKRLKRIKTYIREYLAFGAFVNNALRMSIERQKLFIAQLELQIENALQGDQWVEPSLRTAYQRAIEQIWRDLRRQGDDSPITLQQAAVSEMGAFEFSVRQGQTAVASDSQHLNQLSIIYARTYDDLKSVGASMSARIRTALFDGVQQNLGAAEITRQLSKEVDAKRYEVERIVRTEIINASHEATANEAERLIENRGKEYFIVWITTRDSRRRDLHALFHGSINTVEEYRRKMRQSPYNCRCGARIMMARLITRAKREKWDAERVALVAMGLASPNKRGTRSNA